MTTTDTHERSRERYLTIDHTSGYHSTPRTDCPACQATCAGCGAALVATQNIFYRTPSGLTHCDGCAVLGDVEYRP